MRLEAGRSEILNSNSIYIGEDAGENEASSSNGNIFLGYQAGKSSTLGLNNNFMISVGSFPTKSFQNFGESNFFWNENYLPAGYLFTN